MNVDPDKWRLIECLAEKEGVRSAARRKWRTRGVPAAWQIKLVRAADGVLTFDDFGREPKAEAAA